jgi:large subunit ribosomal protein L29
MKPAEVRELSTDELRGREKELDDQLFRLRIQKSMGQLEAPAKVVTLRRDLARIKTILRERDTERSGRDTERSGRDTERSGRDTERSGRDTERSGRETQR